MSFALTIPRLDASSEDATVAGRAVAELRRQAEAFRVNMAVSAVLTLLAAAGALLLLLRWLAWGGTPGAPGLGDLWSIAFPVAGYLALRLVQRTVTLARAAAHLRRVLAEIAEQEAQVA